MTPKQKVFVREYLIDFNATRAAISAGYSEKTAPEQGSRLLKNVKVAAKLAELSEKHAEKLDISAEYILSKIKQTVERCSQGEEVTDKDGNPTGVWKEDSFAVLKGCELLGKYRKLFTDRIEHAGSVEHVHFDTSTLSDSQLAQVESLIQSAGAGSDKGRTLQAESSLLGAELHQNRESSLS